MPSARWAPIFILYFTTISLSNLSDRYQVFRFFYPPPPPPSEKKKKNKKMSEDAFANQSRTGEIPSYDGDEKAKATDFANYFCSYAQLYHQKQMLVDHNRMASYHQAIMGNPEVFKDKVRPEGQRGGGEAGWRKEGGREGRELEGEVHPTTPATARLIS